jgi:hypothetical protein
MFSLADFRSSYRPKCGLAAASTDERELRIVLIPTIIDCL